MADGGEPGWAWAGVTMATASRAAPLSPPAPLSSKLLTSGSRPGLTLMKVKVVIWAPPDIMSPTLCFLCPEEETEATEREKQSLTNLRGH